MSIAIPILLIVGCYLVGNINPAILIGRARGVDVRAEGSGNAGTTNAMRSMGRKVGIAVFLIDAAKGFLPALLVPWILDTLHGAAQNQSMIYEQMAWIPAEANGTSLFYGLCVILGHMWPVLFKFRGGKGVATTFGVLLAEDPFMALILIGIVLALAAITRIMSLSVLVACAAAIPLNLLIAGEDPPFLFFLCPIVALVIFKHRSNISRLIKGEEKKITFGGKEKDNG
jgi:glycerol-3-phosphate acyltransferase PlsY